MASDSSSLAPPHLIPSLTSSIVQDGRPILRQQGSKERGKLIFSVPLLSSTKQIIITVFRFSFRRELSVSVSGSCVLLCFFRCRLPLGSGDPSPPSPLPILFPYPCLYDRHPSFRPRHLLPYQPPNLTTHQREIRSSLVSISTSPQRQRSGDCIKAKPSVMSCPRSTTPRPRARMDPRVCVE